ncbi:hypothetical protein GGR57DRAFT_508945 [Xylariaceae sp. FL1272]|nr:hypothetical protein GGR57DRAFT_508945 [Xylariaceae sp. FL1272]
MAHSSARLYSRLPLALATACGSMGICYVIFDRLSIIRDAQSRDCATAGHTNSSCMAILNPRGFSTTAQQDSYSLRVPARELRQFKSNEEILARFVYGCFGGWVFTPERLFIQLAHRVGWPVSITKISGTVPTGGSSHLQPLPPTQTIWSLPTASNWSIPQLGTTLFGLFMLLDSNAADLGQDPQQVEAVGKPVGQGSVFAEFVAGSNQSTFAVSQRFEITRETCESDDTEKMVTISASHILCNPLTGKEIFPRWFRYFHCWYAKMLFADGIKEVGIRGSFN